MQTQPKFQAIVGTYKTVSRARNARDKKDMEYGAIRYSIRKVDGETLRPII